MRASAGRTTAPAACSRPQPTGPRSCVSSCSGTSWRRERPTIASDPFDPAYRFDDVDEALREAQRADMEVMLTISGTPRWANGGKAPNAMPTRVSDFTAFARAIASRYSGRNDGYPFVRFWSVWNEPNLTRFLTPAVHSGGRVGGPGELREALRRGVHRDQGGQPARAGRDRRDLASRKRQARRRPARPLARQVRRARREGQPAPQVRARGRTTRIPSTRTRGRARSSSGRT